MSLLELQQLEPLLYAANAGADRAHFEKLLAPDFWEIGASGRRYSRDEVLQALEKRQQNPITEPWDIRDLALNMIAPQLYLFSYTLHQTTRVSRRASIWRQAADGWSLVYHQGTVVGTSDPF